MCRKAAGEPAARGGGDVENVAEACREMWAITGLRKGDVGGVGIREYEGGGSWGLKVWVVGV